MTILEYGTPSASLVLVQPIGDHNLETISEEMEEIGRLYGRDCQLLAIKVENWNRDLSPWEAPAVFKGEDFQGGARKTLAQIMDLCQDPDKQYYIGGYSLAGLFSLWAACQTDLFSGVAAASPSLWFPDFVPYLKKNRILSPSVYLSLGDREAKTRNPVMATVADCIRECEQVLIDQGVRTSLQWNPGNHFQEPQIRMAKAFAWVLEEG